MHYQNLTDGRLPIWRHGRAWWGQWHAEWCVLYLPRFRFGIEKGGYDDNRITACFACGLFSIYLSRSFARCFAHRELDISIHDGSVWVHPWIADDHSWDTSRPWYRRLIILRVSELVRGKDRYECTAGDPLEMLIPMPEGCYRATFTPTVQTWRNRFRTIRREGYSIDIPGGIPFEGKGENGWDCGEDGLFGTGCEGSIEKGIGQVVSSVLESRRRYGTTRSVREAGIRMASRIANPQELTS